MAPCYYSIPCLFLNPLVLTKGRSWGTVFQLVGNRKGKSSELCWESELVEPRGPYLGPRGQRVGSCSRQGLNLDIWYFTPVLSPFELPELTPLFVYQSLPMAPWFGKLSRGTPASAVELMETMRIELMQTLCKSVILPTILYSHSPFLYHEKNRNWSKLHLLPCFFPCYKHLFDGFPSFFPILPSGAGEDRNRGTLLGIWARLTNGILILTHTI